MSRSARSTSTPPNQKPSPTPRSIRAARSPGSRHGRFANLRKQENPETALASRDVIGQAKGILMERFKISADEAFQILVALSQRNHTKLRDLADEFTATGALPGGQ